MSGALEFKLNGRSVRLEDCSPNTTLLEYLRRAGLTGSKEGCAEGDCGACSVAILDRDNAGRPCYRAINSCLVPVCLLAGREIISVEGIACGAALHPVQKEMVDGHGSQCGYCTPGFAVSMFEAYYRDLRNEQRLDEQLAGNLCRCTGYRPIRDACIRALTLCHKANGDDPHAQRLAMSIAELGAIDYVAGGERFARPSSLEALLKMVRENPEARLIAGATELGLDITKRFKKFATLISVECVPELRGIESSPDEWRIGAAATLTEIEEAMAEEFPALGDMLRVFGSRQIRNRATMGGNVVTASPIGDSGPWLLAMDASLVLTALEDVHNGRPSRVIERTIPIFDFFVAYRKTALRPGEVLKTIIVPRRPLQSAWQKLCRWYKVSKRREMDISTVAGCFAVQLDGRGVVRHARLAFGGVAAMPTRAVKTEQALPGKRWSEEAAAEVLPILRQDFTPISDVRGSAEYRRELIASLLQRFAAETRGGKDVEPASALPSSQNKTADASEVIGISSRGGAETHTAILPLPHESGHKHVTGEAIYTDDNAPQDALEVWPVCSPYARAKILKRDGDRARAMPGIRAVLFAEDVPGLNDVGTRHDEPLLPVNEVNYHSQIAALVVGESIEQCRTAASGVVVEYEPLPPVLTISEAISTNSFLNQPNFMRRGDTAASLSRAPMTLEGEFELGGQEHFYLETQAAWAVPGEDGSVLVSSSTQHPTEVQGVVAHVLGIEAHRVVVQCTRMGGGFGGKETQAALPAALAALAARKTGRPVRVRFNRDQDMMITGHRHPFLARFAVGFDGKGRLLAARIHLFSNGGWAADLSQAVTDRALFHLDNAYYIPAVEFRGQVAKTNLSSNTAFRGFGGPQGMLVIEEIMDRVARHLGLPPETVRERNLYRGKGASNTTHYGQDIQDSPIQHIWHQLKAKSSFAARRKEIARWNAARPDRKRGLAITPVKFGISFTVSHLNQAGALVLIYQDGSIQVNHGGTEMGQGVHTNIASITAREFGLDPGRIRVMPTSTDKVPNTSATAASCGTDLNGAAVKAACETLRNRLAPVAAALLSEKLGRTPAISSIVFANGVVHSRSRPKVTVAFSGLVRAAWLRRVSLSATGYYATPGIHWDRAAGRGNPFHYFACGAAVTEVEVDGFTGMMRVLRTDILHDAGESINEGVNRGQIEGGFVQGMGWLTMEELKWNSAGELLTHSPDTYKIPAVGDMPMVFNVSFYKGTTRRSAILGSKAVGEPPLMLAISVREAIRDAVSAFGPTGGQTPLASPATCEAIFMAIRARKAMQPAMKPAPAKPRRFHPAKVRGQTASRPT